LNYLGFKTPQKTSKVQILGFLVFLFDVQFNLTVGVWLIGNMLVSINEVTLHRASGPVSTWMGDRLRMSKPFRYVTSHRGQLSLAISLWVGAMSTGESWGVNRHTTHHAIH